MIGGSQITLTWQADGDTARIERQSTNGLVEESFPVTPNGELVVTVPDVLVNRVIYRLVVTRGIQEITQSLEIAVQIQCPVNWFFGNDYAEPGSGCPTTAAMTVGASYQAFQQGLMFSLPLEGQNYVFALARAPGINNLLTSDQYGKAVNGWDGFTVNCTISAPPGFLNAQGAFDWMACTQFGPGAFWTQIVGFATASIDTSSRMVQFEASGAFYIDAPDGAIYRLEPLPAGQLTALWKRIR